jgi:hypothetical protein
MDIMITLVIAKFTLTAHISISGSLQLFSRVVFVNFIDSWEKMLTPQFFYLHFFDRYHIHFLNFKMMFSYMYNVWCYRNNRLLNLFTFSFSPLIFWWYTLNRLLVLTAVWKILFVEDWGFSFWQRGCTEFGLQSKLSA